MSSVISFISSNFGGIRRKDSAFVEEKITCSDCQNVELYYTGLNSGVGIKTAKGNKSVSRKSVNNEIVDLIPQDEEIIGIFESNQNGVTYFFVYTESSVGKLYDFKVNTKELNLITTTSTVTGNACGVDFTQGWLDMFIFSNGKEMKYIYSDTETGDGLVVEKASNIHLKDDSDSSIARDVKGLGLVNYDSRLWVFDGKVLWYSEQADCRNFIPSGNDNITDAGFIEFVKPITAICAYLGSLAVFHKDSSCLVCVDSNTKFKQDEESPGGCAGYNSLVFHGTDLYFYDDTKKGVFSFQQIVIGDKTLGDNIAFDIQDELMQISNLDLNKIKALSVVTKDRNEVWFLVPISKDSKDLNYSYIMIYDYIRGEWVKRKSQKINTINVINSTLYSAGKSIYEEYSGDDFDGEFIEHFYKCTTFNLGADNTLKITKFPPRVTVDNEEFCHFFVKYVRNYNILQTPKIKELKSNSVKSIMYYDRGHHYDSGYFYTFKTNAILKFPSATFKALEMTLYTTDKNQGFMIKAIEMSKIKIKQV